VGITYGNGQSLGDPSSAVQLSSSVVGGRLIPARAMPGVVARVGAGLDPVDVTDADDAIIRRSRGHGDAVDASYC